MKNNKGFSLVELLGVVALLGILSGTAMMAYSRYLDTSRRKAVDTLANSASTAAEEYVLDHPSTTSVTIDTLVNDQYLEEAIDPSDSSKRCHGKVNVTHPTRTAGSLKTTNYTVIVCCINYNYTYSFPGGTKVHDDSCKA